MFRSQLEDIMKVIKTIEATEGKKKKEVKEGEAFFSGETCSHKGLECLNRNSKA